jgi:hypothetical protein
MRSVHSVPRSCNNSGVPRIRHAIGAKSCDFRAQVRAFRAHRPAYDPRTRMVRKRRTDEQASSTVEYVGLGALAALLGSGLAGALDSTAGDRLGAAIVRRLIAAIAGHG